MRRSIIMLGVIAMVGTSVGCAAQSSSPEETLRTGVIEKGAIDQVVSATGAVYPEARANLTFEQAGYVTGVYVEVGTSVKAGDVLARLNGSALDLALTQAELRLKSQQVSYDKLFEPPSKAQVAGAQAAIASASAAYDKVAATPDPQDVLVTQMQYEQAYDAYQKADMQLRGVQWFGNLFLVDQYQAQLGISVANLESARLKLEQLVKPPDKNALSAASASIVQAQAQLDAVRQGPDEVAIARSKNQINQATLALERSRRQRDGTTLVAPFSGIVSVVNVNQGGLAPTSVPAIVLVDTSHLHVEVNVDEVDIGKVTLGQPTLVQFDALPNDSAQGQVTRISPAATNSAGVVTYNVRIDLAPTELPIRPGMTATADIVVQRVANVLLVPNWAVRFDRATGQAFAGILGGDGKIKEVPVVLGIRSNVVSQVIAGLQEGQTVAVTIAPGSFQFGGAGNQGGSSEGQ